MGHDCMRSNKKIFCNFDNVRGVSGFFPVLRDSFSRAVPWGLLLCFVLLTSGCASTYYTELPSRQPAVYTESTSPKDEVVAREVQRAMDEASSAEDAAGSGGDSGVPFPDGTDGTHRSIDRVGHDSGVPFPDGSDGLQDGWAGENRFGSKSGESQQAQAGDFRFRNMIFRDGGEESVLQEDSGAMPRQGSWDSFAEVYPAGEGGDAVQGIGNAARDGVHPMARCETEYDDSEAIIEALSERLSYYESLAGSDAASPGGSERIPDALFPAGNVSALQSGTPGSGRGAAAEDIISSSVSGARRTVTSAYNFVNSTTVYSYVKGMVYDVFYHPEHATSIRLQAGEALSYAALGDSNNWTIETLENTEEGEEYTYVHARPFAPGETDLHLYTDRRVYHFRLISSDGAYQVQVEFRYPDSDVVKSSGGISSLAAQGGAGRPSSGVAGSKAAGSSASSRYETATAMAQGVRDLNFNYRITGSASWKPVRAYSDTVRTYIQFPNSFATNSETPIVLLRHNGRDEIVDFTGRGITYIVPLILSTNEVFVLKAGREECYVGY